MQKTRAILLDLLEHHKSRAGKAFGGLLLFIIFTSIAVFIGEHIESLADYHKLFRQIDIAILIFFTVEYLLRILIAPNRIRFIFSPLGLVDLFVILPIFGHFANISFLRGFRVLRTLQILKFIRQSDLISRFLESFRYYQKELQIFWAAFIVVLAMSALAVFGFEYGANPEFRHLGDALWWAVVTISNVGYGDMVPVTIGGKIVGGIVMMMGIATVALMTAILTKIFIDHFFGKRLHSCRVCHYPHHDYDSKFCKNCGNPLDTEQLKQAEVSINRMHNNFEVDE